MTKQVCTTCNNTTNEGLMRGNGFIELVLWLAYIIPGVIYSIWRRGGEPSICPACKKETLKPYDAKEEEVEKQQKETIDCEWCAEPIKPQAKLCKHCKKDVTPREEEQPLQVSSESNQGVQLAKSSNSKPIKENNETGSPSSSIISFNQIMGLMFIVGIGFSVIQPAYQDYLDRHETKDKVTVEGSFICKSVMAKVFGYEPEDMRSVQHGSRYTITWTRVSDGLKWGTHCWVQNNNRIMWKTDGRNNTNGRLRNGEYDENITYSINGNKLTINEKYSDGSKSKKVYKVPASEIASK